MRSDAVSTFKTSQSIDGAIEGVEVGEDDGSIWGKEEGADVGAAVGDAVGVDVEGETVGASLEMQANVNILGEPPLLVILNNVGVFKGG